MTCFFHRMPLLSVLFLLVVIWPFSTRAAEWAVSVDERSGLPQVTRGGSPAVASQFVFWGGNWDWADFTPSLKVISPYVYAMEGKSQRLDFDATGQIRQEDEQTLSIDLVLNAHSMKSNVMGGGIVFNFDPALAEEMGVPVLLPDNRGWTWGNAQGRRIEMRFEPALAKVYFEPGDRAQVRAFLYKDRIKPGRESFKATVMANYISRANAAVIDLRQLLNQG